MPFEIILTSIAVSNIEAAYEYYVFKANKKVGEALLVQIFDAFKILEINPFFPIKTKSYRGFKLSKYPYIIFYQILEETQTVKILALFHTSQNPEKYP